MNSELKNKNVNAISDERTGFQISSDFERFNQINDIFSRAFWDNSVRSKLSDAFLIVIVRNLQVRKLQDLDKKILP